MDKFVGQNVQNITLKKQSDVVIRKVLSVEATVTLPDGVDALEPGQVLITVDGGITFNVVDADDEANGILCEALTETSKVEVLVIGAVKARYLVGLEDAHKPHLFTNKIILK